MIDRGATHAGGLVIRELNAERRVLIVRPSGGDDAWVLPKGHIEEGERADDAAVREVAEEAGVLATVERPLIPIEFHAKGKLVRVAFYLMRFAGETTRREKRGIQWVSFSDAERLLTHRDSIRVLRAGISALEQK